MPIYGVRFFCIHFFIVSWWVTVQLHTIVLATLTRMRYLRWLQQLQEHILDFSRIMLSVYWTLDMSSLCRMPNSLPTLRLSIYTHFFILRKSEALGKGIVVIGQSIDWHYLDHWKEWPQSTLPILLNQWEILAHVDGWPFQSILESNIWGSHIIFLEIIYFR